MNYIKTHFLRIGLAAVIGLAIPTAAVLAKGPDSANKGQTIAAQHKAANSGKADEANTPETAGSQPHNHGWFVSQVAKSKATTGRAHGQAVSAEAQSSDGK
jgi:hypothetical protein